MSEFYQSSFGPPPGMAGAGAAGGMVPQHAALAPGLSAQQHSFSTSSFEDEPPLLEELGINVEHIWAKALMVLNPLSKFDPSFADEPDMSGPVLFCLLLGVFLLLGGKVQFGQIYGQASIGCVSIYLVLNLMSQSRIDMYRSTSILGYSLLPMVIMAGLRIFLSSPRFQVVTIILGAVAIAWCTIIATKIFVAVLSLREQTWLVGYPLGLLYTSFALITVF
ncbi:Protein YIPF7 [Porphyridium purpureum]|uniref:Protein YIPF n=1 Tax=Porphyridium purpureum TaxID=35688 RepID=A0A5J4YSD0_PORPP|nr:Protein YIPF7 [Porphyridium purpureum]|eukprot:POR1772..scf229_5